MCRDGQTLSGNAHLNWIILDETIPLSGIEALVQPLLYLPANRVQLLDLICHVFVDVEGVDDRVDFEGHFVLLAPTADFVEAVQVALPALSPPNQLVGLFIKTVTRDC